MNAVIHFEMPADDRERMAGFYNKVFGWQTQMLGPEMGEYVLVTTTKSDDNGRPENPGAINGGFYKRSADLPVQYPAVVIHVDDLEASIRAVESTGGEVLGKPDDIPNVGRFVYFKDTEGNVAGMLQPSM